MDKLLINCSKIEDGAAFSASCARLGIEKISSLVGDFAILKLPDKYKKTKDPEWTSTLYEPSRFSQTSIAASNGSDFPLSIHLPRVDEIEVVDKPNNI